MQNAFFLLLKIKPLQAHFQKVPFSLKKSFFCFFLIFDKILAHTKKNSTFANTQIKSAECCIFCTFLLFFLHIPNFRCIFAADFADI